jgi:hypothetical protein
MLVLMYAKLATLQWTGKKKEMLCKCLLLEKRNHGPSDIKLECLALNRDPPVLVYSRYA